MWTWNLAIDCTYGSCSVAYLTYRILPMWAVQFPVHFCFYLDFVLIKNILGLIKHLDWDSSIIKIWACKYCPKHFSTPAIPLAISYVTTLLFGQLVEWLCNNLADNNAYMNTQHLHHSHFFFMHCTLLKSVYLGAVTIEFSIA